MTSSKCRWSCYATLSLSCITFPLNAQTISNFGTPGLIETPTAEMLPDGELAFTGAYLEDTFRGTLTFQMSPWAHGTFRYSIIDGFDLDRGNRYDRSFDLHFRLREETKKGPAVTLGFRDFGGTGLYASEYFVATKTIKNRFKLSGGIGWGRMAGRGSFSNPFGFLSDSLDTRDDANAGGISTTGQVDFGNWFRGDAALFAGASWQYNDRWTFMAEFSPDLYSAEASRIGFDVNSPINVGAQYTFENGSHLTASYLYGSTIGLSYTYRLDPRKAVTPGGQGDSPPPLLPIARVASQSWNLADDSAARRQALAARLDQQGLDLVTFKESDTSAVLLFENGRYGNSAQAIGRAARTLANTLPPKVREFDIAVIKNGVEVGAVKINRADLLELERDLDGAWRSYARAEIADRVTLLEGGVEGEAYPRFTYRLGPYLRASFFDPDSPLRYETGASFGADLTVAPGITLSTGINQPILGNLDDTTRESNSVIQRVRSDWATYARESDLRLEHLTAEYIWRPGSNLYGRATVGYLEQMYGGASAELLWFPVDSRLALGLEANYVKQRDFDVLFGFQDYSVATGHMSAYYDFPGDYHAQLDVGRYLAGDYGATFSLDREFRNGFKVGAFFTLTDVGFDDFGEGSFDKGLKFEVPVSWFTGRPSRDKFGTVIRPVLRDGGARLNVRNRLYEFAREARAPQLDRQWGRFFR